MIGRVVKTENFEQVEVRSATELRSWLERNHEQVESVWLITFLKHRADHYVSRNDVLDELVAFGWIDGVRRKLDGDRTMQLIGPRRTQHWAKTYKDRATRLIELGRMHEAGFTSIEDSKHSGMWTFMDDVDALIAPDDLVEALDATPDARENYEAFPPSTKRNTLRWIKLAKTDATRAKRVARTAELAASNKRVPNA